MLEMMKVEMPKDKVVIRRSGKNAIKYVYYIKRSYRNEKGQPTGDFLSIGKYDDESGMLIPNNNFFEIFDCEITIKVKGLKTDKLEKGEL